MSANPQPPLNPFPGLRPFRSDEHHLFFGREDQTAALLQLLRERRFLAVVGTSGSGKSSLVRAGAIAELHGGAMTQAGSAWEVMVLRPGGSPIENLARAMVESNLYDAQDASTLPRLLATLSRSRFGLVEAIKQSEALEPATNVLVVVDQFEELFRFRQQGIESEEAAAAFVNLLLTASEQAESAIYVTLTMRSDYLGDCSEIPGLAEAVNEGEYLIPRLLRDQKRDAIEKPIGVGGASISPLLVQRLLNDVGDDPDQLPVLQHALMRMWDAWSAGSDHSRPIDFGDFEATGGLTAALSNHADEIYDSLPDDAHRSACERIFKTLTVKGDDNRGIRRPKRLSHLQAIAGADRATITSVLDAYRRGGVTFVMPGMDVELGDRTVLDLSHESLMRGWQRLRAWVEDEAQSSRTFRRLSDTALLWRDGKAGLFRDPDLQIALSWREQEQPSAQWAEQYGGQFDAAIGFLEKSGEVASAEQHAQEAARRRELEQAQRLAEAQQLRLEQQQRSARKLRTTIGGLAVVALVAGIASVAALIANDRATELRIIASREADQATQSAVRAEQSAQEANRQRAAAQLAEQAMERTATQAAADRNVAERESYRSTIKLAESMLLGDDDARFRVADILWQTQAELRGWEWGHLMARCPLEEWSLQTDASGLSAAAATADGRFLATAGNNGAVSLWDLNSRQQAWQVETGLVYKLAVDPTNRFVGVSTADKSLPKFRILDLATGSVLHESQETGTAQLAFSPSGEEMYVFDEHLSGALGALRCIATSTWELRGLVTGIEMHFPRLFADASGNCVGVFSESSGTAGPKFRFFDGQTLGATNQWDGLQEQVENVRSSADPVLNSELGEVIFSFTSEVYRKTVDGKRNLLCEHSDYVKHLAVDGVSGAVLSATANGAVKIVDADGGMQAILHGSPITALAALPEGRFLTAGANGLVKCWKLTPPDPLAFKISAPGVVAGLNALEFAGDGKSLLCRTWDRHNFLYELESLSHRHFVFPDRLGEVALFPTIRPGTNELVADSVEGLLFFPQGSEGADGDSTRSVSISRPGSAAFDAAGRILVVSSHEGNTAVFDLESNGQLPGPELNGSGPVAINLSGTRAAIRTKERFQVWEVATGKLLEGLDVVHDGDMRLPPVFHPDGELIAVDDGATGSWRSNLIVWDSNQGRTRSLIHMPAGTEFRDYGFSADGQRLFFQCSDHRVRVFDWTLGKELIALSGGTSVDRVAVSPDGLTVAYAGFAPSLFVAKSLPRQENIPRETAFYAAVDDLRLYSAHFARTSYEEAQGLVTFTNRSDKLIRIDIVTPSKVKQTIGELKAGETTGLPPGVPNGIEFLFIDPESSQQLESYTTAAVALDDDEGPVGINVSGSDKEQAIGIEEILGDVARRQGRHADANAHYTNVISIEKETILENPSKAAPQGRLAIALLKNLANEKAEERTELLRQAADFWQELMQHSDSSPAGWRHLLSFQLRLLDHRMAIGSADSGQQLKSLLTFWSAQSELKPENRQFAYGLSEVCRRVLEAYPDGFDREVLDALIAEHPGMVGVLGDVCARDRDWAQAIAFYSRGIQQDSPPLELFAKRARAYEQQLDWEAAAADWLHAASGNPDWSTRLVELVRRLADRGEVPLADAVGDKACVLFEQQLEQAPGDNGLMLGIAELILRKIAPPKWTPLIPTELKSHGGEKLTVESDGSIFVGGATPDRAVYALKFRTDLPAMTAIRLETVPDARLPKGGAGRSPELGKFHLSEFTAAIEPSQTGAEPTPIVVMSAFADTPQSDASTIKNAIDGNLQTVWDTFPQVQEPHWAVFGLESPTRIVDGYLIVTLDSGVTPSVKCGLGRFRLWATMEGDPTALIAAMKLTDPLEKLAAAYHILGDQPALDKLIERHPEASARIGEILRGLQ